MYINDINSLDLVVSENQELYRVITNENQYVEVLVDFPGNSGLFTYRIPSQLEIRPGDILSVPFGSQQLGAIAIRLLAEPNIDLAPDKIREVEDVVTSGFFASAYWELLNRVASYYYTPLIQVIRVALPPGLLGRSQRRVRLIKRENEQPFVSFLSPPAQQILQLLQSQPSGDYSFHYLQQKVKATYRGMRELLRIGLVESYLEPPRTNRPKLQKAVILIDTVDRDLTNRQREILEVLRRRGGELWHSELLQICSTSSSTLKSMEQKGYIAIEEREVLRTEQGQVLDLDTPKLLNIAQENALATIQKLNGFAQVLLHGVTGSGKTEVYLQAIAPILAQGKSALVLVPEIGLTPQLTDRFRARFGNNKISVYHSALSDGERYDTWRQMLTGTPQIVIGTRSAIFAPLPNLGLIILDEEHDSSFKQDSPIPTYHARTVAQWRAELENCPLVLGSATPSLESWVSVSQQSAVHSQQSAVNSPQSIVNSLALYSPLPERINSRPLPPVEIVDMRQELQDGNRSIFSRSLQAALQHLEQTGKQGILFIHRRGHSTFVSCRSCGYVVECPHCDVSLAYHQTEAGAPQLLRCHYCNYVSVHPKHCPECSSPYLKFFGSGTQRVAQELSRQFPGLKYIRFDSDTTRNKGAHRTLLTQFANGEANLLVGTQMLTKGLDLPQVTLVGVVAADGLLNLSDYRASERAFQTLTQVAGRAGRGDDPGRVIMQTYTPEHPVIEAVKYHNYQSFVQAELEQRQALNYPPYGRLILLRLSSFDPIQVQNTTQAIATVLNANPGFELLGPAPASVMRVANRYRWQILLKFAPEALPQLPDWDEVRLLCPDGVNLTIDVDPLNIM
ncbi:primosomal protein N' [Anabaena sp. FACHB-709]|uniref:Replication restart protein PriA n=2 Tax=Nostocaceae TaxID=1162 RepID=A0A1Z4KLL7_ANAVA|nr:MULTISPECIES: primosomal protein N' [Nostocaceae]BAY69869.1 primosomal protein N' [Trichormus variabilis NIES-23]HBW33187.1 primosomal protein N' [Nostoc sp. UBA8866]MBD2172762.1 primosomal protein N' [Anabaena cylindrica FACHB-318]MBD2264613.1 primosomal protein N' [Anabaena sp. FACHB-709]MBD2273691.1 primosomal protein N' [Nostoc sp. PCC 7120 = FACHB-418]